MRIPLSVAVAASGGAVRTIAGKAGAAGFADGEAAESRFLFPSGVVVNDKGDIFVADLGNHCIRVITKHGRVLTIAGNGEKGMVNGDGANARFNEPSSIALGESQTLYVAERGNHSIRMISLKSLIVTTLAGGKDAGLVNGTISAIWPPGLAEFHSSDSGQSGISSSPASSPASQRQYSDEPPRAPPDEPVRSPAKNTVIVRHQLPPSFRGPFGIAVDESTRVIYISDTDNNCIRMIKGKIVSTLAGSGADGFVDADGIAAQFSRPFGLAINPITGDVIVADQMNNCIRVVDPKTGSVRTLAGSGKEGAADGDAAEASFKTPRGIAIDQGGVIFVADAYNNSLRRLTSQRPPQCMVV